MIRPTEIVAKEPVRAAPATETKPPMEEVHKKPTKLSEVTPERRQQVLGQKYQGMEGRKMKQEGGVPNISFSSSLNVMSTPFGAYDAAIIAAVKNHWYALLEEGNFVGDAAGMVVLEFKLHYDGRISDVKVAKCTVSILLCNLCRLAITDPAPYERWPNDMRRVIGSNTRDVAFTFYYN